MSNFKKLMAGMAYTSMLVTSIGHCHQTPQLTSGYYAGLGIGYKYFTDKQSTSINPTTTLQNGINQAKVESLNADKKLRSNVIFGVHAGYDYIQDKLFSALEFDYRYSPSFIKGQAASTQALYGGSSNPYTMELKHQHDFGLSVRLGGMVTPQLAVYAIGDARLGLFQENLFVPAAADTLKNTSENRTLFGYGGGVGFKYAFQDFTIGLDATYNIYQKINIPTDASTVLTAQSVTAAAKQPRAFNAIFKISKTF